MLPTVLVLYLDLQLHSTCCLHYLYFQNLYMHYLQFIQFILKDNHTNQIAVGLLAVLFFIIDKLHNHISYILMLHFISRLLSYFSNYNQRKTLNLLLIKHAHFQNNINKTRRKTKTNKY